MFVTFNMLTCSVLTSLSAAWFECETGPGSLGDEGVRRVSAGPAVAGDVRRARPAGRGAAAPAGAGAGRAGEAGAAGTAEEPAEGGPGSWLHAGPGSAPRHRGPAQACRRCPWAHTRLHEEEVPRGDGHLRHVVTLPLAAVPE